MRKKILILLMAVAFAAASLLAPATAFADADLCVVHNVEHNGVIIAVDAQSLQAHLDHGDTEFSVCS